MKKTKYHRIGSSRLPASHQPALIAENLKNKTGSSVKLGQSTWHHDTGRKYTEYSIALLPGLNGEECYIYEFKTWPELIKYYRKLMRLSL